MNKIAESQINYSTYIFRREINLRSDKWMDCFLAGYFLIGLALAGFYNTWFIAIGVGGLCCVAYYSAKFLLPQSSLYQYVMSVVLGIFMAQFIYQMHGLLEMHFFGFIGSTVLITYQKWKLQIPLLIVVLVHHTWFNYLQDAGFDQIYFSKAGYFDLQTLIIHMLLTASIFFICGLWSYQMKKYNEKYFIQTLQMTELQKEVQLSKQRKQHAEEVDALNIHLRSQAKELAFSNAELEQFAYVASHDLQEPLRTITSFLTLIEKRYDKLLDDKGRQYIHFAVDGAKRMRQIIKDLLEFSRAGKEGNVLEQVDISQVISEIKSLYHKQLEEHRAQVIFNDLPMVCTFRAPIEQVFRNLVANGLKYQQPGSKPVITITFSENVRFWKFSVSDNGIGISSEFHESIFVIFKRLHTTEQYQGTGMGLAVTKKLVEYLGGNIWVDSEAGKGSTFNFTIAKNENTT